MRLYSLISLLFVCLFVCRCISFSMSRVEINVHEKNTFPVPLSSITEERPNMDLDCLESRQEAEHKLYTPSQAMLPQVFV